MVREMPAGLAHAERLLDELADAIATPEGASGVHR
jgi:hypothetical protein